VVAIHFTDLDTNPDSYPDPDRHQNLRRDLAEVCTVPELLVDTVILFGFIFVSDIAIFVLKRDVKLQLTN